MCRTLPRLLVALLTFTIGSTIATIWVVPHFRHSEKVVNQNTNESLKTEKTFNCSNQKPVQNAGNSSINKSSKSSWKWSEMKVSSNEDFSVVQFLNANEGWVGGSKGALYKTTDAGQTWQKIKLDISSDTYISSISFVSPSVGWIVASQEGEVFDDINSVRSRILNTTDGGKSWQSQYFDKALQIYRTRFINEQEGWAIGSKIPHSVQYAGFIIHTTDGGTHWTDVSTNADRKEIGNTDSVVNIFAENPSQAIILKFSREFYSTTDGGQSWQKVGTLPDEPPQSFLGGSGFGISGNNSMWAAGGADSIEGMWGSLALMNDCKWTTYTIGGVYFADMVFLSDNQVIVCGSIPTPGHEMPRSERDGLILESSDRGRNWTIAYRSNNTRLSALAMSDANNIWAVGEGGYIIHLQSNH